MSLCINPCCLKQHNRDSNLFCSSCGSELLLSGRYRVIRKLEDDGSRITYEVNEVKSNTHSLLQILIEPDPEALEVFLSEVEVLSQINGSNMTKAESHKHFIYFHRNSQQPIHCLVMENIVPLQSYMGDRSRITLKEVQLLPPAASSTNAALSVTTSTALPATRTSQPKILAIASFIIAAIALCSYAISIQQNATSLAFASQMILLAAVICLIPTIRDRASSKWEGITRIIAESLMFAFLLLGFSLWLFGTSKFGIWYFLAVVLILILEAACYLVEHYKVKTFKRLTLHPSLNDFKTEFQDVKEMFKLDLIAYIIVPIVMAVGAITSLISGKTPTETIVLCFQLVLVPVSLVLFYFIICSFVRMSNAFLQTKDLPSFITATDQKIASIFHRMIYVLNLYGRANNNEEWRDIELASTVSVLRQIYLYESIQHITLLIFCLGIIISLFGMSVDGLWFISALLVISAFFNQFPYFVGQRGLHKSILQKYNGAEKLEIENQLIKSSPLFPLDNLWLVVIAGCIGVAATFLFDQILIYVNLS